MCHCTVPTTQFHEAISLCWICVNHLNAGEIWQVPDLLGQGAVCPLDDLLKAFGICGVGHEANFTTRTSGVFAKGYGLLADCRHFGNNRGLVVDTPTPLRCHAPCNLPIEARTFVSRACRGFCVLSSKRC